MIYISQTLRQKSEVIRESLLVIIFLGVLKRYSTCSKNSCVTGSLSIGPVWNACIWPCFGYAFDAVGIPRNALQSIPAFALRTAYALHPSVSLGIRPALYRQICIWNAFGTSELSPTDLT